MAGGGLLGSRLEIDNDVSRLLPDSSPELTRATKALTRLMDRTVVDIGPGEGPIALAELGRIADEFAVRLTERRYSSFPELPVEFRAPSQ